MSNPERIVSDIDTMLAIIQRHHLPYRTQRRKQPVYRAGQFRLSLPGRTLVNLFSRRALRQNAPVTQNPAISVEIDGDHRLIQAEDAIMATATPVLPPKGGRPFCSNLKR
jgi:hypothetical protein